MGRGVEDGAEELLGVVRRIGEPGSQGAEVGHDRPSCPSFPGDGEEVDLGRRGAGGDGAAAGVSLGLQRRHDLGFQRSRQSAR
jgi:hypothetical protein